jgi:hypothetical protein
MTGVYLTSFLVTNNYTMLSGESMLVLAILLTLPLPIGILILEAILSRTGINRPHLVSATAVFLSAFYALFVLRGALFDLEFLRFLFESSSDTLASLSKLLYYLMPAAIITRLFYAETAKLAAVLGVMSLAAIVLTLPRYSSVGDVQEIGFGSGLADQAVLSTLNEKPNIYLLLADSYGSFAHLRESQIDVSDFTDFLGRYDFRMYDDVYSNYHATTAAMPAMLNMAHHYYSLSHKASEISKSGRQISAGNNDFSEILRRNGYEIQYIHQGAYLLLHGCSADVCYGYDRLAGVRTVTNDIVPRALRSPEWQKTPVESVKNDIRNLISTALPQDKNRFQYVHLYQPGHVANRLEGICDESKVLAEYSTRVNSVNIELTEIIKNIVDEDPSAVIVLAGDHGPMIANNCSREAVLSTPREFRDRIGVLTSIRWPPGYDGRYDEKIKTNVNTLRYLLAYLSSNEDEILKTLVPDDAYVLTKEGVLGISGIGTDAASTRHISPEDLQKLRESNLQYPLEKIE